MENKNSNTGYKISIIVLAIVVIGLCAYIAYDYINNNKNEEKNIKVECIDKKEEVSDKTYTYKEIAGQYNWENSTYKPTNSEETEEETGFQILSLSENGTFIYDINMGEDNVGYIGNYTIEGNTIHLNFIFRHGSDASIFLLSSKNIIDLTINDENTIIDTNNEYVKESRTDYANYTEYKLTKDQTVTSLDVDKNISAYNVFNDDSICEN